MYDYKMRDFNDDFLDQIIYRGEGNSSIVVALKDKSKVIRLLKRDGKIMKSSQDNCVTQHPMRSIRFIHSIMKPLTSPYLSDTTRLVHLKSNFISMISKRVEFERPAHRLDKTLNLDDQYALVMDDLCALPSKITKNLSERDFIGPTISVEIKPKQGFLLPQQHLGNHANLLSESMSDKIFGSCLYGLHQHFKLARGRIEEMSNYCPLNLFSGCPVRMKDALQALINNPQNNLRIFKNLTLTYDETNQQLITNLFENDNQDTSNMSHHDELVAANKDQLIDLLIQCLLSESTEVDYGTLETSPYGRDDENSFSNTSISDQCLEHSLISDSSRCEMYQCSRNRRPASNLVLKHLAHKLPKSCVLACVLRAQRLDTIGPFTAKHMLEWLLEDNKNNSGKITYNGHIVKDVLEELSKPQMPNGFGAPSQLPFESQRDFYFRKVWEFLVSLTAKDCSIIVTIRQITRNCYESLQNRMPSSKLHNLIADGQRGNHYVFHVGIADFDQKMPLKILRICENLNQIMLSPNDDNYAKWRSGRNVYCPPHAK